MKIEPTMPLRLYWHNFRTGKDDYIETPTDYHDYIPQEAPAQKMYELLLVMGRDPAHAAMYVLEAVAGVPHLQPLEEDKND